MKTTTSVSVEDYPVAKGVGYYHVIGTSTNEIAYCARHADAVRLVTAYNAHEELVAALRLILEGNTMAGRENWSHADVIQEHYKIARKALNTIEKGS